MCPFMNNITYNYIDVLPLHFLTRNSTILINRVSIFNVTLQQDERSQSIYFKTHNMKNKQKQVK